MNRAPFVVSPQIDSLSVNCSNKMKSHTKLTIKVACKKSTESNRNILCFSPLNSLVQPPMPARCQAQLNEAQSTDIVRGTSVCSTKFLYDFSIGSLNIDPVCSQALKI